MTSQKSQAELQVDLKIEHTKQVINKLESELQLVEQELANLSGDRQKYDLLTDACDRLNQLDELSASPLFWNGLIDENQVKDHLLTITEKADFFQRRIATIVDKQAKISADIKEQKIELEYLFEDIETIIEEQEASNEEFIVLREVPRRPYQPMVMPWVDQPEDKKRFRKITFLVLLLSILFAYITFIWVLPIQDRNQVVEIPERLTKFIKKQKPEPKPKEKVKPVEELKKQEEKKPTEAEKKEIRKKVQSTGVLAFKNNFADLLDDDSETKLGAQANLSNRATSARVQRSIITANASASSGGINSSALSRDVNSGDKTISAVGFSRVDSAIGTAIADDRPLSSGPGPSRTDEEIQIVFDRYKAALYRIYNRKLRVDPSLQGKIVLRITIEPDGSVSLCKIESTDMASNELNNEIVDRVKLFNFGAKPDVPKVTILYPIDFLPAS
ncbi:MAG TPA: AgmX/PglI C-terminal domain-containing protein [Pseudomonadales bacterium]